VADLIVRHVTQPGDAAELAPRLRAEDRAEVLALGRDPLEELEDSVARSAEAFTWRLGDEIVAMAGVNPTTAIGTTAVPWMLGSDLIPRNRRYFVPESRRVVDRWQAMWPRLVNVVDAEYRAAVRWLRHLGFTMTGPVPIAQGMFWIAERERA